MQYKDINVARSDASLLSNHAVLRNTYLLLSLTLLFSSAMAAYAVFAEVSYTSSLIVSLAAFGMLFVIGGLRNSAWGLLAVFAFTGCMGFSMGPMLNHFIKGYTNGGQLIMTAMAGTGVTFLVSSAYLITTKKDLSGWGKFLMIGLVVCIVAGLANIFFKMPAMQLAISSIMVFISTMLMMFDTSRIINGGETNYIMATVSLFLDILMLFQNLLMLLGVFGGNSRD
ncbi:MAG: Bax inhibitor-1 family protein [Gammaproteobacteria bacterium]|nr:Bax inhibitor-1 family protein [Gammaproteobacteria bacterium]